MLITFEGPSTIYTDGLNLSSGDAYRNVRLNLDILEDSSTLDAVDKIGYIRDTMRSEM